MKVLVIVAHPNTGKSFNHAIASTVVETLRAAGHEPVMRDLYAGHFDPVLPYNEEKLDESKLPNGIRDAIGDVRSCDGIVFIHPNWWGAPPAILKGWIDRVLRAGFAYHFTDSGLVQHLTDKTIQVFSTSNTPRDVEINVYKDPLEHFWKDIVFGLCGYRSFERRNFESVIMSTPEERAQWLANVAATIERRFPAA